MAPLPLGNARGGFEVRGWAVSYRQIIDLGDFNRSLMAHTTGQSGSPFSKHYDDMIKPWLKGQLHPMLFDREEIERRTETALRLIPE
jgi:penicillin amidase